jgi:hypothetical protein
LLSYTGEETRCDWDPPRFRPAAVLLSGTPEAHDLLHALGAPVAATCPPVCHKREG